MTRATATQRESIFDDPILDFTAETRRGIVLYAPIVNGFEKFRQVVIDDRAISTQTALAVDYMLMQCSNV